MNTKLFKKAAITSLAVAFLFSVVVVGFLGFPGVKQLQHEDASSIETLKMTLVGTYQKPTRGGVMEDTQTSEQASFDEGDILFGRAIASIIFPAEVLVIDQKAKAYYLLENKKQPAKSKKRPDKNLILSASAMESIFNGTTVDSEKAMLNIKKMSGQSSLLALIKKIYAAAVWLKDEDRKAFAKKLYNSTSNKTLKALKKQTPEKALSLMVALNQTSMDMGEYQSVVSRYESNALEKACAKASGGEVKAALALKKQPKYAEYISGVVAAYGALNQVSIAKNIADKVLSDKSIAASSQGMVALTAANATLSKKMLSDSMAYFEKAYALSKDAEVKSNAGYWLSLKALNKGQKSDSKEYANTVLSYVTSASTSWQRDMLTRLAVISDVAEKGKESVQSAASEEDAFLISSVHQDMQLLAGL